MTGAKVLFDVFGANEVEVDDRASGDSKEAGEYVRTERRSATGPVTYSIKQKGN